MRKQFRESKMFAQTHNASTCETYSQMGCWISHLSLKTFLGYFEKQKKAKNNKTNIEFLPPRIYNY